MTKRVLATLLALATISFAVVAEDVQVDPAIAAYKPVEGVAGNLSSVGSDTLNNLMTLWAEGFRKLYPNVDFYSGIILREIGIPVNMFTVMFAMGRMPGWIAHWKEQHSDANRKIARPRQIYTGPTIRSWKPVKDRS